MTIIIVAWIATAALLALGVGAVPFPRVMSRVYGVRVDDPAAFAYVRSTGTRNIALAVILLVHLSLEWYDPAAVVLLVVGVLAVSDFANAVRHQAPAPALLVHAGGAAAFAIVAAMLAFGDVPEREEAPGDAPAEPGTPPEPMPV